MMDKILFMKNWRMILWCSPTLENSVS